MISKNFYENILILSANYYIITITMPLLEFSKDYNKNSSTVIDNKFISDYLPEASGDAVKVYLYGISSCSSGAELDLPKFCQDLNIDENTAKDCFRYWEEFGLVDIVSSDPFMVKFLPITSVAPKKFKPEKYTEFNKSLQVLIPDRLITTSEYSAYFSLMEAFSVKPEAMLMIVKYCVDLKGSSAPFRYVLKVANDFASRGLTTTSKIEKELSAYTLRTGDLADILAVVSPDKKPDVEDSNYLKKWTDDFSFTKDAVIATAKLSKVKTFQKLDRELSALFAAKKFSPTEIGEYYDDKNRVVELAYKINRTLSVYNAVIDPVVDNYVYPWINKGYDEETLLFIANYCFKKGKCSLSEMDRTIDKLYKAGLVTLNSIVERLKEASKEDELIKEILSALGVSRKPTEWDRENLSAWRNWNFSDEMILAAAKISAGKNPAYVNAVLSSWKAAGIYSVDRIPEQSSTGRKQSGKLSAFDIKTHKYTKEELESLIVDIDDLDL